MEILPKAESGSINEHSLNEFYLILPALVVMNKQPSRARLLNLRSRMLAVIRLSKPIVAAISLKNAADLWMRGLNTARDQLFKELAEMLKKLGLSLRFLMLQAVAKIKI